VRVAAGEWGGKRRAPADGMAATDGLSCSSARARSLSLSPHKLFRASLHCRLPLRRCETRPHCVRLSLARPHQNSIGALDALSSPAPLLSPPRARAFGIPAGPRLPSTTRADGAAALSERGGSAKQKRERERRAPAAPGRARRRPRRCASPGHHPPPSSVADRRPPPEKKCGRCGCGC